MTRMDVEIQIFKKKEKKYFTYSMYQAAQLTHTDNCVLIFWVNTAVMIYSQNTPASPFVEFIPALLLLHLHEHTFVITLPLLREEAHVIQDTMLNKGLKVSVQKEVYILGFSELELVLIGPAMCKDSFISYLSVVHI